MKNYQQQVIINTKPEKAFQALTSELPLWWGRSDSSSHEVGDTFKMHFGKAFWQFEVVENVPHKSLSWKCIDGQPGFEKEWVGTTLHWLIEPLDDKTASVKFTHNGLTPAFDCYHICAPTWDQVITSSLKLFVETGTGEPLSA